MGAQHDMQIHTHTQFTVFLLDLLLDLQAGQLAPGSHVGNRDKTADHKFLLAVWSDFHILARFYNISTYTYICTYELKYYSTCKEV
jgi:hypothetical protein